MLKSFLKGLPSLSPQAGSSIGQGGKLTPGTNMLKYLMHNNAAGDPFQTDGAASEETPPEEVVTSHPGGLKRALALLGIQSERNRDGLSLNLDTARRTYYGDQQLDDIRETEFRTQMYTGDPKFDRKKMRRFVNDDGSTTFEMFNDDKSVMNKFTFGEFQGKKLFAQGGYDAYAGELKKVIQGGGDALRSNMEFDDIRQRMIRSMRFKPVGGSRNQR